MAAPGAAQAQYTYKTRGRGRGILGLKEYVPCRRPGCVADMNVNNNGSALNNDENTSGANLWTYVCCAVLGASVVAIGVVV